MRHHNKGKAASALTVTVRGKAIGLEHKRWRSAKGRPERSARLLCALLGLMRRVHARPRKTPLIYGREGRPQHRGVSTAATRLCFLAGPHARAGDRTPFSCRHPLPLCIWHTRRQRHARCPGWQRRARHRTTEHNVRVLPPLQQKALHFLLRLSDLGPFENESSSPDPRECACGIQFPPQGHLAMLGHVIC